MPGNHQVFLCSLRAFYVAGQLLNSGSIRNGTYIWIRSNAIIELKLIVNL